MPTLNELCERYFGCSDLYEVLKIPKTSDEKQVRKAYHRLSLIVHPDRVGENEKTEATEKFKVLGKVHAVLSDKEKRAIYDETGTIDEEDEHAEKYWTDYWEKIFKKITIEDINNYEKKYKGSEEELNDLKEAYVTAKGDMDIILQFVPFTNVEEEERYKSILQPFIESGELPAFKAFTNESPSKRAKRIRKWKKEAKEIEALEQEENMDLTATIQKRSRQRMAEMDSLADYLAEKYAPKKKKTATSNKVKSTKSAATKKRGSRAN